MIELLCAILLVLLTLFKLVNVSYLIGFFLVYLCINTLFSITAILLEVYSFKENTHPKLVRKLIGLSIIEALGYRQLISIYRISALIGYRKSKHKWGRIARTSHNAANKI